MPALVTNIGPYDLGTQDPRLPAYIWMVDKELDLSILRDQFSKVWHSLKVVALTPTKLEGESINARNKRLDISRAHFAKIMSDEELGTRFQEELIRHGSVLPHDSPFWGEVNQDGLELKALIHADSIEQCPRKQRALAGIILHTLHYLFNLEDPLAAGLANSIWQSLRIAAVSHQRLDLPDTVCEKLFSHPDVLENPFSTLQLDRDRAAQAGGGYHQTWFVERIMTKGTLWVGSYHPLTFASDSRSRKGIAKAYSGLIESRLPQLAESLDGMSILGRQVWAQVVKDIISREMLKNPESDNKGCTSSDLTSFYLMLHSAKRDRATFREVEEERAQRLVSTFNVDGPCVVATPFSSAWEMLPHPEIRSMSTCWVVEEVDDEPSMKEAGGGLGQFTGRKADKGKLKEGDEEGDKEEKLDNSGSVGRDNTYEPRIYKVVGKVKGLWELIPSTPFKKV
ncbi:hypothetical protein MAPG_07749 [Magnaporthiopsis poae ATCC 64411]|uniref:Uncharacterized protein n=1 Tax=Magnaporthiopsis poae (strain ATCC 64411 / 73-15) TaxID=644358 RepID=A0A0C4E5I0_MAGP6|nr:hypothetical protein MAPG_07749 [Magnaporthiopsis poae ATCC 64411]